MLCQLGSQCGLVESEGEGHVRFALPRISAVVGTQVAITVGRARCSAGRRYRPLVCVAGLHGRGLVLVRRKASKCAWGPVLRRKPRAHMKRNGTPAGGRYASRPARSRRNGSHPGGARWLKAAALITDRKSDRTRRRFAAESTIAWEQPVRSAASSIDRSDQDRRCDRVA